MEKNENPPSKTQKHAAQVPAPRSTAVTVDTISGSLMTSVISDAEDRSRPCVSAQRNGREADMESESGGAGKIQPSTLQLEHKPFSFQRRFQNLFRRYVGDPWHAARESRIGPVGGPWEAVAIHSMHTGKNSSFTGGCSGFLWRHGEETWGLTHGSIIAPLLEMETDEEFKEIMEALLNRKSKDRLPESFGKLKLHVQREGSPDFNASFMGVWICSSLSAAFDDLLSTGWDFYEDDPYGLLKSILSMVVVFRPIGEASPGSSTSAALAALLDQVHRGGLARGSPILAISSPFTGVAVSQNKTSEEHRSHFRDGGGFNRDSTKDAGGRFPGEDFDDGGDGRKDSLHYTSPFMNSWSQGVVSRSCCTGDRSLFLTDARAMEGSEGGPLFVKDREGKWILAGMMLRSICYWRGEWVGFSLACYLEPTLKGYLGAGTGISSVGCSGGATKDGAHYASNTISSCPVVLVKCGYTQGSGIPINGSLGLILTCAHVVRKHHLGLKVIWKKGKKLVSMNAEVIYLTDPNLAYDVAVISVGPGTGLPTIPISQEHPEKGDIVWLVGYAMHFGSSSRSSLEPPLLSRGIVSTVMPGKLPSILQTTCCVQAGSSGGAVIREKDCTLLGMMVCNTATETFFSGSSKSTVIVHPSINFTIPAITLSDTLTRFYKTQDPLVLKEFQSPEEKVQQIWKLKLPEPGRSKL